MVHVVSTILCALGAFVLGFMLPEALIGDKVEFTLEFRFVTGVGAALLTLGICLH